MVDYPLSYADALMVFIIAGGTTLIVRRSYGAYLKEMLDLVRRAGQGDIDLRLNFRRHDAIGDLADAIDVLLSRRASESAELAGCSEEFALYKLNTEERLAAGLGLAQATERRELVAMSARMVLRLVGAEHCLLFFNPPVTDAPSAWYCAAEGDVIEGETFEGPDQFARRVMEEGSVLLCENIEHDESYHHNDRQPFGLSYNATLVTPLFWDGEVVGALQLCEKRERFDSYDEESMEVLARFIVAAMMRLPR